VVAFDERDDIGLARRRLAKKFGENGQVRRRRSG
jgi:hypothetical protein